MSIPDSRESQNVSIVYWTVIGLLNVGEVAAVVYAARHKPKIGQPDAPA